MSDDDADATSSRWYLITGLIDKAIVRHVMRTTPLRLPILLRGRYPAFVPGFGDQLTAHEIDQHTALVLADVFATVTVPQPITIVPRPLFE